MLLLSSAACASPVAPSVAIGDPFTLAPGEAATVEGTAIRVQFLRVTGDSRCPANVLCIQGGDAIVHLRIAGGAGVTSAELHTGDLSQASAAIDGVWITLVDLQPYPFSSRTIHPAEYRATLRATNSDPTP
jgi:hypothetical protein